MSRKIAQPLIVAFLAIIGLLGVAAGPVHATSVLNGGCTDHPNTEPCISKSGNFIYADFYQIKTPDASMRTAILKIIKNGREVGRASYTLTRTGRYGPISNNVATLPPTNGSAYSRVEVYTSTGSLHYAVNSPTQTW
ncbi:hypothetical protein ABGB17_23010 [Sphaerisporangium sp. B11E5]|uniref:hypothetical protein n=1 Tax=Sphaerisporangium sp. B11E5 TaxID=3153563 RepID=UPI00325F1A08